MHGIGNDFVLIDTIRDGLPSGDSGALSQRLCDRSFGVGADGLILVEKDETGLVMKMFNPDGSESEMCGNGVRTFAILCHDRGYGENEFAVKTGAGTLKLSVQPNQIVSVEMGMAILNPSQIGMINTSGQTFINQDIGKGLLGTAISLGNPHLIIFVDDVSKVDVQSEGPILEKHSFFPHRTNVHFVQVKSRSEIIQRTWERGAGETLACGTGACACAVASFLNGKTDRNVKVHLPGGSLDVFYREDCSVQMSGEALYSFEGNLSTLLEGLV